LNLYLGRSNIEYCSALLKIEITCRYLEENIFFTSNSSTFSSCSSWWLLRKRNNSSDIKYLENSSELHLNLSKKWWWIRKSWIESLNKSMIQEWKRCNWTICCCGMICGNIIPNSRHLLTTIEVSKRVD